MLRTRFVVLTSFLVLAYACGGRAVSDDAAGDAAVDVNGSDTAMADSSDVPTALDVVAPRDVPADVNPDAPGCLATSTTDLTGVHLVLDASRCLFTLAQARAGLVFPFDLTIDANIDGVIPRPQDAGGCGTGDPSGLFPFGTVSGAGQSYCICDTGLCPGPSTTPITLTAGTFHGTFEWDGTNWMGPSDTGNPHGPAFPVGTYAVRVSAVGTRTVGGVTTPFTVASTLPITLVP